MYDKSGQLILLDSGQAFKHGPFATKFCDVILCGIRGFPHYTTHYQHSPCPMICRFWKPFIDEIRKYLQSHHLENKLKSRLEKDALSPLFQFASYSTQPHNQQHRANKVKLIRLPGSAFYFGIRHRMHLLLDHVQACIDRFSDSQVWL